MLNLADTTRQHPLELTNGNNEGGIGLTWHRITDLNRSGMPEMKLLETDIYGKKIGLLKRGDHIYAFAAKCPHAGARMCDGWLDAQGRIVCPDHKYRFDPANGRNTSGEGYKLFTYPVDIREDEIWVGLMSTN
ncbi:MAG: Rieske 2Fe-2S domain-containing protein [Chitinophagaceae bacterium]|nr:Rieske 2Fe-2S domain-containing protein [Chitinophagaceae bacterium]